MTPKIADKTEVKIADDGLARLDGIPIFRKIERDGIIYVQFQDRDRMRSQCRGSNFVEIPFVVLYAIMCANGESDG